MLSILNFIIFFIFVSQCFAIDCPGDQKLYKELGCTPVMKDGQPCPVKYNCPDLASRDSNKCYLNGKEYSLKEKVPENELKPFCAPSCFCDKYGDNAKFICAHYDCAEYFGYGREPDCTLTYDMDSCCSKDKVCGDARDKLAKCYMDGKTFYEGQRIYPESESCHKCLCTKGFDNSTVIGNKDCEETVCGTDLHHGDDLKSGCVPVYYGDNKCCPITYKCPKSDDEVISNKRSETGDTCNFGNLKLFVGDELKTSDNKILCNCITPPFIQCVRERDPNY